MRRHRTDLLRLHKGLVGSITVGPYLSYLPWQDGGMKNQKRTGGSKRTNVKRSVGAGRTRPPFERMKKIFGLLQDGTYPNCTSMAAEFEVAAKTVRRDLDFMRERWELPIEYDDKRFG